MRKIAAIVLALLCVAGFIASTSSLNFTSLTVVADGSGAGGPGTDPGG
jgi:hypothetical protein